jgi:hypothetical protein
MPPLVPIPTSPTSATGLRPLRVDQPYAQIDWPSALSTLDPATVEILKQTSTTSVARTTLTLNDLPVEVVLKTERSGGLRNRLRIALANTRLHRHWNAALLLHATGAFPTARCHALLLWKAPDNTPFLTLVMEALPGQTLLQTMAQIKARAITTRQQHRLAEAVANQTASLMRAKLYNRDHKPSNLIVTRLDPPELALIDVVGLRSTGRASLHAHCASLVIEAIGTGVLPRRALLLRALKTFLPDREQRHAAWHAIALRIRDHGDPTPKDNPLVDKQSR